MCVVNWGEVYYSVWRDQGPGFARHILAQIAQLPIHLVPADVELARHAAEFKANFNLPYVDGFAAALAVQRKASLATSDRDFAHVEKKLDILWTM
jgi:predicted nucleic acid-binding protein